MFHTQTLFAFSAVLAAFTPSGQDAPTRHTSIEVHSLAPVRYQKALAPFIATSVATYPAAKAKFLAGLSRKEALFVSVRVDGGSGPSALAVVKVSDIDGKAGLIYGRSTADLVGRSGIHEDDDVTVHESDVIDWKITHADGSVEGDALGKYVASLGPGVDTSALMVDQRDKDLSSMERSQTVGKALDQTFVDFFGDKELKIESVAGADPATKEWPSLVQKYHDLAPEALAAELSARADAVKATRKVIVESAAIEGKSHVLVSAYVVLKKGDVMFEIFQVLDFRFADKKALDRVAWGQRDGQWIVQEAKAK